MKRRNIVALAIFGIFYVSFGALFALNQERIVYQPFPQDFESCADFKDAEKVTHNGTRMYVQRGEGPVALLYHGNAGSACDRAFYARLFTGAGYGYVIVEYAGYSNDPQKPTHDRIKQDVKNVISYLQENEINDVTIVGESIGTGVAAYHASLASPEKLLLISPFTNLADVARNRFWFYPTSLLVDNAFDTVANLEQYDGHVTIIYGTADTIIPYKLSEELFQSLKTHKNLVSIPGAGHNDLFLFEETYTAINNFLKQE